MFGCCEFLSFSLVFCRFGGRLGTTLYIHFIWRWVEATRRSSAPRENEDEKKAKKSAILRSWALWGRFVNRPVQLTTSASFMYWTSPLWRRAYTVSRTAARHHVSVPGMSGAAAPLTTSTAPISANMSSLRRVRSRVRRKRFCVCTGIRQLPLSAFP